MLRRGVTIVEVVIAVAVLGIIVTALARTFSLAAAQALDARSRSAAVAIASAQMEALRNLPYDAVAVQGGVPAGNIPPHRTETRGAQVYNVATDIRYEDDPFDGTLATGDVVPTDYKRATVTVTWGDASPLRTVQLQSFFVPRGRETVAGGGTLVVTALDAAGASLPDARVHITNSTTTPPIDLRAWTDADGRVVLPGAPAAQNYAVTVMKPGYETVGTLPPYPQTAYRPTAPHPTVVENDITSVTLSSGAVSHVTIALRDHYGAPMPGASVRVEGGRVLGTRTDGTMVYSIADTFTGDARGDVVMEAASPGVYTIASTNARMTVFRVDDGATVTQDTCVVPQGVTQTCTVTLLRRDAPVLIVHVKDAATRAAIVGARVRVAAAEYDANEQTDTYGAALFDRAAPLRRATYSITVTADGYAPVTARAFVDGMTEKTVTLTAQ